MALSMKIAIAASTLLALGGCASDGYYGGIDMGYGSGYGYAPGYYGPAGYGYGGWYNDYYYPGTGYYVFDRAGNRQRWNDNQRAYWERRRSERPNVANPGRNPGQWQGNRPGNVRPGQGQQQPRPNDRPVSKADRESVRTFGQTIEQRRADDARDNGVPYVPGGQAPADGRGRRNR